MKGGLIVRATDHRDLDFHKSFGTAGFDTAELPTRYSVDPNLTMPDQNADGFYYGCTGYSQTDLCTDQDFTVYDAGEFYLSTPPGGLEGRSMRASLNLAVKRGPKTKDGLQGEPRTAYYNIRARGILDWFDAVRVALWITQNERRAASIAIPWMWGTNIPDTGILSSKDEYSWKLGAPHNAVVSGWTDVRRDGKYITNGEVFLEVKWWGGKNSGDNGWAYMPRDVANSVLSLNAAEAFTMTKNDSARLPIDLSVIERLVSYIQLLLRRVGLLL